MAAWWWGCSCGTRTERDGAEVDSQRTSPGALGAVLDRVAAFAQAPASSTVSMSISILISLLTSTPPASSAMFQVMPKSSRLT